jgi:hypothetical protein
MKHNATLPLTLIEMESMLPIIPQALSADEAGPAFYIATPEWSARHNFAPPPWDTPKPQSRKE